MAEHTYYSELSEDRLTVHTYGDGRHTIAVHHRGGIDYVSLSTHDGTAIANALTGNRIADLEADKVALKSQVEKLVCERNESCDERGAGDKIMAEALDKAEAAQLVIEQLRKDVGRHKRLADEFEEIGLEGESNLELAQRQNRQLLEDVRQANKEVESMTELRDLAVVSDRMTTTNLVGCINEAAAKNAKLAKHRDKCQRRASDEVFKRRDLQKKLFDTKAKLSDAAVANAELLLAKMADAAKRSTEDAGDAAFGMVRRSKYDDVLRENERLKESNNAGVAGIATMRDEIRWYRERVAAMVGTWMGDGWGFYDAGSGGLVGDTTRTAIHTFGALKDGYKGGES